MSTDRARLTAVPGLAKVPGPPTRRSGTVSAPDPGDAPSEPSAPTTRAPNPPTTKPAPPAPERSTSPLRDMSFTTPLSIRERLRRAASDPHTTKGAVVLAAVEANVDQLIDLVEAERATSPATGNLFPDPAMTLRAAGEPRVPESLRLTERNLGVLDRLVATTGAENRSQLLTAALRAHLTDTS